MDDQSISKLLMKSTSKNIASCDYKIASCDYKIASCDYKIAFCDYKSFRFSSIVACTGYIRFKTNSAKAHP